MQFRLDLISKYRNQLYGVSILWIILYHGLLSKWLPFSMEGTPWLYNLLIVGDVGVDIFLLLSGMSLYYAYAKKPSLNHFMFRRLIRIYLPYWVICTGFFITWYLVKQQSPLVFAVDMAGIGFWVFGPLREVGTWYMGAILVCYLMYPYIYAFIFGENDRKTSSCIFRTALLLLIAYVSMWAMHKYNNEYFKLVDLMVVRFPVFIVGCLLGKFVYEKRSVNIVGGWATILACFIAFYILRLDPGIARGTWWFRASYLFGAIAISYLLSGALSLIERIAPKAGSIIGKPLAFCGGLSFELYLSTQMLRWSIGTNDSGASPLIWLTAMIVAFVFAFVASKICQRMRHAIESRESSHQLAS